MSKILHVIISIAIANLFFTPSFAEPFWRTSDTSIELAWQTFRHAQTDEVITLIANMHWAPPEFYYDQEVFIVDKHVIYEGVGDSLANRKLIELRLDQLSERDDVDYHKAFMAPSNWVGKVTSLGQIRQSRLEFDDEDLAHHADVDLMQTELGKIFFAGDHESMISAIDMRLREASKGLTNNFSWSNMIDHIEQHHDHQSAFPKQSALFKAQREILLHGNVDKSGRFEFCHQKIVEKISLIRASEQSRTGGHKPRPIVVIYGAHHLDKVAEHVESLGYVLEEIDYKFTAEL